MSKSDGHIAIMTRLATMPDAPNVIWPNDDGKTPNGLPRIVMSAAGGPQSTVGLTLATDATPEVLAMVETAKGDFGAASRQIVNQIMARFPVGLGFDGVVIETAPDERPPMPSSAAHRVPVYIRGRIFF